MPSGGQLPVVCSELLSALLLAASQAMLEKEQPLVQEWVSLEDFCLGKVKMKLKEGIEDIIPVEDLIEETIIMRKKNITTMTKSGNILFKTISIIVVISLSWSVISIAEEEQKILQQEPEKQNSIIEDLKDLFFYRLGRDARYIITSPKRLDKSCLISIITIGGLIGGLMAVDQDIRKYTRNHHNQDTNDFFSDYIDPLGDGRYGAAILGLFYLGGSFFQNDKAKETALMGIESMACAGALSSLGKLLIGRQRPKQNKGAFNYTGPSSKSYKSSFPSGHTTIAFSLASVIAEQYDNMLVDILAYGTASAVGFQRVYDDNHWLSDVFAGAILGTLIGKTIVKLNRNNSRLKLKPIIDSKTETIGIAFDVKF
jgi:membrane-associated phospholipid phosphatase